MEIEASTMPNTKTDQQTDQQTGQQTGQQTAVTQFDLYNPDPQTQDDIKKVNSKTHIALISNDCKVVVVTKTAIKMSKLLDDVFEEVYDSDKAQTIPLPNVNHKILLIVVEYIEHHWNNLPATIEKPLEHSIYEIVSAWDKQFILKNLVIDGNEMNHANLIDTIHAANFMGIPHLTDLTCATLASLIRGKKTDEIKKLLGIKDE